MKCDLHTHSNCSDGVFSPEALVDLAKEKGLDCIALTDHDTVDGIARAQAEAKKVGLKLIVGTELSCYSVCEVHVLGYNMNISVGSFAQEISQIVKLRNDRNQMIVDKLAKHGIFIDLDSLNKEGTVGRGVMARKMVEMGVCSDIPEVFEKYLGPDGSCYVKAKRITPVEAIQFILKYGGVPVLAHPKQLRLGNLSFDSFLKPLVSAGLMGIEAKYFTHNDYEKGYYGSFAKKYNLIVTGGSDFHDYGRGPLGEKFLCPSKYTRLILGI